jgi:hypothetical protein
MPTSPSWEKRRKKQEDPFEYRNDIKCRAWDIQAQENARDYAYFAEYLLLGPGRSISKLRAKLLAEKEAGTTHLGAAHGELMNRCAHFKWVERAELHEREQVHLRLRDEAHRRRERLRIELQEYQQVQHQMSRGLASLAGKVLTRVTTAIDRSSQEDWTLDRATRLMGALNQTAAVASGMWSDSLGVSRLLSGLDAMDQKIAKELPSANDVKA